MVLLGSEAFEREREKERLLVQQRALLVSREEPDRLFPGARCPGTTSTWQGDCRREMATQGIQHWAFTHLWCGGREKTAASWFVHVQSGQ